MNNSYRMDVCVRFCKSKNLGLDLGGFYSVPFKTDRYHYHTKDDQPKGNKLRLSWTITKNMILIIDPYFFYGKPF